MTIPGVVGFRRGGLWREFFITFSTYAYVRTLLTNTPNNPPHHPTHHRLPAGESLFLRGAIPGTWLRALGGGLHGGTFPLVSAVVLT